MDGAGVNAGRRLTLRVRGGLEVCAAGQALAPGSLVSVFGPLLALGNEGSTATPLPTLLAGATFTLNGVPMPQFFNSPQQSNLLNRVST